MLINEWFNLNNHWHYKIYYFLKTQQSYDQENMITPWVRFCKNLSRFEFVIGFRVPAIRFSKQIEVVACKVVKIVKFRDDKNRTCTATSQK